MLSYDEKVSKMDGRVSQIRTRPRPCRLHGRGTHARQKACEEIRMEDLTRFQPVSRGFNHRL
jgi:hypothetical protein